MYIIPYLKLGAATAIAGVVIYAFVLVHNLRAENAVQAQTIENQKASLQIANAAADANAKAALALKAQYEAAQKSVDDAHKALEIAQTQLAPIIMETVNAPASDKVCASPALWRAANRLFEPAAPAGGSPGR